MTCSPSQMAISCAAPGARQPLLDEADEILARHGGIAAASLSGAAEPNWREAATATALMDLFRRTRAREVFDLLVEVATPDLLDRARYCLRLVGGVIDPQELLQDALVNIFSYPDKFVASRSNAFGAWSAAIVSNAMRRLLRQRRSEVVVALSPIEVLSQQPDQRSLEPDLQAVAEEESRFLASAYAMVLSCYLSAFERLSERERFVLQMVEVERMRYVAVGELLGIRPEAIKMVVFRARKRIFERVGAALGCIEPAAEAA